MSAIGVPGNSGQHLLRLRFSQFDPTETLSRRFGVHFFSVSQSQSARLAITRGALHMQRREFISLIGGAAVVWPLAGRAQQNSGPRKIGVLFPGILGADRERLINEGLTKELGGKK